MSVELETAKTPTNLAKPAALLKDGKLFAEIFGGMGISKFLRGFTSQIIPNAMLEDFVHIAIGSGLTAAFRQHKDLKNVGAGIILEGGLSLIGKFADLISGKIGFSLLGGTNTKTAVEIPQQSSAMKYIMESEVF